jgi:S-adenosylmethionine synthetase
VVFYQQFMNNQQILIKELIEKKKEEQGAGDQGMMFGYATNETDKLYAVSFRFSS